MQIEFEKKNQRRTRTPPRSSQTRLHTATEVTKFVSLFTFGFLVCAFRIHFALFSISIIYLFIFYNSILYFRFIPLATIISYFALFGFRRAFLLLLLFFYFHILVSSSRSTSC